MKNAYFVPFYFSSSFKIPLIYEPLRPTLYFLDSSRQNKLHCSLPLFMTHLAGAKSQFHSQRTSPPEVSTLFNPDFTCKNKHLRPYLYYELVRWK